MRIQPLLGGAGLAFVTMLVARTLPDPKALVFLAVILGFAAGVYVGLGLADGRSWARGIETAVALAFLAVAAFGLWTSPLVIAFGFLIHGVWDFLHHRRVVKTTVSFWFPSFCAVYDLLLAAYMMLRWMERG